MESLGEFLQIGRTRANLSLEDLAARTRIRIENLRALEKGELEELPSEIYVRGFVKLVCRELGLAPEEGIVRYDILREALAPPDEMTWEAETVRTEQSRLEKVLADPERLVAGTKRAGRLAGWGIGVAVVAGLLFVGVRGVGRWVASREKTAPTRVAAVAPEPEAALPEPEEAATAPPEPAISRPAKPEAAKPEPAISRPAKPEAAKPEPRPDLAPARVEPSPVTSAPPREASVSVPVSSSGRRLVLRVEARRSVEVSVLLDGVGIPRTRSLTRGESKIWKADSLFRLSASDAGALRVSLDGVAAPALGPDGVAVERVAIRPSRP